MPPPPASNFHKDPLGTLNRQIRTGAKTFWVAPSVVCISEPEVAKRVLANPEGDFREHSDFFHTRRGLFGPRSVQVALGRSGRSLLSEHVAARSEALPELIARELDGTSEWPDAGNHLIYRHLSTALVAPEHRSRLGGLIERIIERGVLAGARERRSRLARAIFRRRAFRALTKEIERRVTARSRGETGAPRDLFDVLAEVAGPTVRTDDLAELYLPFFFAVVGSVGFTLAWSIFLLGTNPPTDAEPEWVVREALRLWPIAWQLGRRPARALRLAEVDVGPRQWVLVSPYVTQRHPAYWSDPEQFRPERWAETTAYSAFFPFGWGPHTCAAASLTLALVRDVLATILRNHRLSVSPSTDQPFTGPSLAPPPFLLTLRAGGP